MRFCGVANVCYVLLLTGYPFWATVKAQPTVGSSGPNERRKATMASKSTRDLQAKTKRASEDPTRGHDDAVLQGSSDSEGQQARMPQVRDWKAGGKDASTTDMEEVRL